MCSVDLRAIEPPRLRDDDASMAWKLHAIEKMQLRGAMISTQAMEENVLALMRRQITEDGRRFL